MKDLSFALETLKRSEALRYHLTANFYPPLPEEVKAEFVHVFEEYWASDEDIYALEQALMDRAGYVGSLFDYDFHNFLKEEDLNMEGADGF